MRFALGTATVAPLRLGPAAAADGIFHPFHAEKKDMKAHQVGRKIPDPGAYSDMAASAVDQAAQSVRDTADRLTEEAAPATQRLQDNVLATVASLNDSAGRMRQFGVERGVSLRGLVRNRPLGAVATAAAIGFLVARIAR